MPRLLSNPWDRSEYFLGCIVIKQEPRGRRRKKKYATQQPRCHQTVACSILSNARLPTRASSHEGPPPTCLTLGPKRPHKHKDLTPWSQGPIGGGYRNLWFLGLLGPSCPPRFLQKYRHDKPPKCHIRSLRVQST